MPNKAMAYIQAILAMIFSPMNWYSSLSRRLQMIAVPCGIKNQLDEKFHSASDSALSGAWRGLLGRDIGEEHKALRHA